MGKEVLIQKFVQLTYKDQKYSFLKNKFMLKQLVLIETKPFKIYLFSNSYIKQCRSQRQITEQIAKYNLYKQRNYYHLNRKTNILQKKIPDFNSKIKQIIKQTILCCSQKFHSLNNTFQLCLFKFVIDSNREPWLISVNTLKEEQKVYFKELIVPLFNLLLPQWKTKQNLKENEQKWQLIYPLEISRMSCSVPMKKKDKLDRKEPLKYRQIIQKYLKGFIQNNYFKKLIRILNVNPLIKQMVSWSFNNLKRILKNQKFRSLSMGFINQNTTSQKNYYSMISQYVKFYLNYKCTQKLKKTQKYIKVIKKYLKTFLECQNFKKNQIKIQFIQLQNQKQYIINTQKQRIQKLTQLSKKMINIKFQYEVEKRISQKKKKMQQQNLNKIECMMKILQNKLMIDSNFS